MTTPLSRDGIRIDSPLGRRLPDTAGSPIGVARLDPEKSYAGVGDLLQQVINDASPEAWDRIKGMIDYTYAGLDLALTPLKEETGLEGEIRKRLNRGQQLLFKPNLVSTFNIDPQTHGTGLGNTACTEWPFMAALMRWFHDRLGVRYHQMALGEAATVMSAAAGMFSLLNPAGKAITTEAVIEGRSGDFYGGWGFYFVRKYLSECPGTDPADDPMQGYEASVAGSYTPPGQADLGLSVVDLNRISDDQAKGREIPVPDGVNFKTITLHKAVIGGDPADPEDRRAYPGCILVNVPKLKVHNMALFTNVIKNLGIGLYPMQFARSGDCCWEYSNPHQAIPGMKGGLPHEVWVPEMDPSTCLPRLDPSGQPSLRKTGGLTATMVDIVRAVQNQDIFMIHVVDAIEATNLDHTGSDIARKEPEGMVFAGLDPIATDLLCARYLFSNVPLAEALAVPIDDGQGGRFPQAVPLPVQDGNSIRTEKGYDCPLLRDNCFAQGVARGLGQRVYHVSGWDMLTESPLVSLEGHLGRVGEGAFVDVITDVLYVDLFKFPWDLQKTAFGYLSTVDALTGSSFKEAFLQTFDENGDGIVSFDETGRKGIGSIFLHQGGYAVSCMGTDPFAFLSGRVKTQLKMMKIGHPQRNPHGYDFLREFALGSVCMVAFRMSQLGMESPDPFVPGLTWGLGKWPSFQMAQFIALGMAIYGQGFPYQPGYPGFFGAAFFYADLTQGEGKYMAGCGRHPDPENLRRYVAAVQRGEERPLDFTFYVPPGYDNLGGLPLPNVAATEDPARVLTVWFKGGEEVWGQV